MLFPRDQDFVDRSELSDLEEKLSAGCAKVALVGLGGIGYDLYIAYGANGRLTMRSKSQLAIEHCYRVRDRSSDVWTFWIHASNGARFDADIRKLAGYVGIPGCDDPKSDVFALVDRWLSNERKGKWVLVLDNVDDARFLFEPPDINDGNQSGNCARRKRMDYLRSHAHGSIIITSRSREATARLTDDCDVVTVNPMKDATALALLEKKLGQSGVTENMQKLVTALDRMPLALAQAGAHIKQRGLRYSVGRYLAELEKSEKSQTSLLKLALKELRRDDEAKDSIILTWQVSFDYIRKTRPSAAGLLSLMSMYNYQGIPEFLLKVRDGDTRSNAVLAFGLDRVDSDCDGSSTASETDSFDDDILTLENFHFIRTMFTGTSFEMHRLVRLATRVWLGSHGSYQEWARRGVEQLDEALPNGEHKNWGRCAELYPHVTSILSLQLEKGEIFLRRASVQYKAAWFDWRRGLWSKAEALAEKSYNTRGKLLGMEDEKTLSALHVLASVVKEQGRYEAAEEANRQVLEVREKVLGKEHPDTLTSVNNLAVVLRNQGD